MSWFHYGDRMLRGKRGRIYLRVRDLTRKVRVTIHDAGCLRPSEHIDFVRVLGSPRKSGNVILEVWGRCYGDYPHSKDGVRHQRWTVFHVTVRADPKWICEGDF